MAVTWVDARMVTGTVAAMAPDQSSITLQAAEGRTLTLVVADPRELDWTSVGDTVQVTYTPGEDGTLRAQLIQSSDQGG